MSVKSQIISGLQRIRNPKVTSAVTADVTLRSVADNGIYPDFCTQAAAESRVFHTFKRHPVYTKILEQLNFERGQVFLDYIRKEDLIPLDSATLALCQANDSVGMPLTTDYASFGRVSNRDLYYLKTCSDLKKHFGSLSGMRVAEIGPGYGGQAFFLDALFSPAEIILFDLAPVLMLIQRYLESFLLHGSYRCSTINQFSQNEKPFDLVISNHVFSELPRPLQLTYLERIVARSARGYILINHTDIGIPPITSEEMLQYIPSAKRYELAPKAEEGSKNYHLVWGHKT